MISLLTPKKIAMIQSPVFMFALKDTLVESPKSVEDMSRCSVLVFLELVDVSQSTYVKIALDIDLECDLSSCT